jgi:hypothetical protein
VGMGATIAQPLRRAQARSRQGGVDTAGPPAEVPRHPTATPRPGRTSDLDRDSCPSSPTRPYKDLHLHA